MLTRTRKGAEAQSYFVGTLVNVWRARFVDNADRQRFLGTLGEA